MPEEKADQKQVAEVTEQEREDFQLPSFKFISIPMPEVKPARDQERENGSQQTQTEQKHNGQEKK